MLKKQGKNLTGEIQAFLLVDTNVSLDFVGGSQPEFQHAYTLFSLGMDKKTNISIKRQSDILLRSL